MTTISTRCFLISAVLSLGLILAIAVRPGERVSLVYHGVRYGQSVIFEFTNATHRTITYNGTSLGPELHWMTLTSQGWKRSETAFYGPQGLPGPRTLAPSQGIVFGVSPGNTLCRITIIYSDGRSTNGFWRILPRWITDRLPWLRDPHTLESPVFSLNGRDAAWTTPPSPRGSANQPPVTPLVAQRSSGRPARGLGLRQAGGPRP